MGRFTANGKIARSAVSPDRTNPIALDFGTGEQGDRRRKSFAEWLCRRIETGVSDRQDFDDEVRRSRDQYESEEQFRDLPWAGAANLEPPQTRTIVDSLHAHTYKALFGVSKYFQYVAEDPDDAEAAQAQEDAMQSVFTGRIPLARVGASLLKSGFIDGTGIAMPWWKVDVRKRKQLELIDQNFKAVLMAKIEAGGDDVENAAKLFDQIQGVPDGSYRVIETETAVYNDACVDEIDVLNFITYPAKPASMEDIVLCGARTWNNADTLWHGVKSGMYDAEAVEGLCATGKGDPSARSDESQGGDADRDESFGLPSSPTYLEDNPDPDSGEIYSDAPFQCVRGLVRYDYDNDGLSEWVLYEVSLKERVLLRAEAHPYFHDKPIFVPIVPYPRKNSIYGYSLCGILSKLQEELSIVRNQRVHNGTLKSKIAFTAKRGVQHDFSKQPFVPGMVIPVRDHDDFKKIDLGADDQHAFAEEEGVRRDMREVSGASETVLGTPTGNTTLGELERTLQNTNTKFDVIVDAVSAGFVEVASQVTALYGQYMPDTMRYSLGDRASSFSEVTREQMQANVGISVRGTSSLQNRSAQAQIAEKLVMMAERSPFMGAKLTRRYHVERRALDGFGIPNPEELIGTLEEARMQEEEAKNAPPPMPERRVQVSERRDEMLTLATAIKTGEILPEEYTAAVLLATQAQLLVNPVPPGAEQDDATDNAAGYERKSQDKGTNVT